MKNLMRTILISLVVSVAAMGVAAARQEPKTDPWKACEADFTFEGDHIYVSVSINDKDPFRFCHDTGAPTAFVLLPSVAQKNGFAASGNTIFKENKITLDYEKGRIAVWQRPKK